MESKRAQRRAGARHVPGGRRLLLGSTQRQSSGHARDGIRTRKWKTWRGDAAARGSRQAAEDGLQLEEGASASVCLLAIRTESASADDGGLMKRMKHIVNDRRPLLSALRGSKEWESRVYSLLEYLPHLVQSAWLCVRAVNDVRTVLLRLRKALLDRESSPGGVSAWRCCPCHGQPLAEPRPPWEKLDGSPTGLFVVNAKASLTNGGLSGGPISLRLMSPPRTGEPREQTRT